MDNLNEQLRLHVAGATVRHKSQFDELSSYKNNEKLSNDFIGTWVVPFYLKVGHTNGDWISQLIQTKDEINKDVVLKLLGDFNWRTRKMGTFFAALKNYEDLIDIIGIHFLKSEVCYVGKFYAYTFASFNTTDSSSYLDRYLTYYLSKPELCFDQPEAMEALAYLDKVNKTNLVSKHTESWMKFISNKPHLNKNITTEALETYLQLIKNINPK